VVSQTPPRVVSGIRGAVVAPGGDKCLGEKDFSQSPPTLLLKLGWTGGSRKKLRTSIYLFWDMCGMFFVFVFVLYVLCFYLLFSFILMFITCFIFVLFYVFYLLCVLFIYLLFYNVSYSFI
jgi:hypothetical protein